MTCVGWHGILRRAESPRKVKRLKQGYNKVKTCQKSPDSVSPNLKGMIELGLQRKSKKKILRAYEGAAFQ